MESRAQVLFHSSGAVSLWVSARLLEKALGGPGRTEVSGEGGRGADEARDEEEAGLLILSPEDFCMFVALSD